MAYNLITEQWIPVRRASDDVDYIAPYQITTSHQDNPVVAIHAPRPDFNGALLQFLIGLLQTCLAPESEREWKKLYNTPPGEKELKKAFMKYEHAFILDGDGKRFLQDATVRNANPSNISALFIESPGANTVKRNSDHFIKRGSIHGVCTRCAATALFTLQINAPAGGQGILVSLRGGGPLTTIVQSSTIWSISWLNVLPRDTFFSLSCNPKLTSDEYIFPWLGYPEAYAGLKEVNPEHVHPYHMFWGMPRRIELDFDSIDSGTCDVCAANDVQIISQYRTKPRGLDYGSGSWLHPLTPHVRDRNNAAFPVHASSGCTGYRHWLGLVIPDEESRRDPAPVVEYFLNTRMLPNGNMRLYAFGYDMDNMKARCWYEGMMPLMYTKPEIKDVFEDTIQRCIKAADIINRNTRDACKKGLFGRIKDITKKGFAVWEVDKSVKLTKTQLATIGDSLWQDTEADFYRMMNEVNDCLLSGDDILEVQKSWHNILCRKSLELYDLHVTGNAIEQKDPRCIVLARRELEAANHGSKIKKLMQIPDTQ